MTPDILADLLAVTAAAEGWTATIEPDFIATAFRGHGEDSTAALPQGGIGLRIGHYPILILAIGLTDRDDLIKRLREAHNQMIIARSYMSAAEIINAHIMLVAETSGAEADWQQLVDLAQRDENVCRKLVWLPDSRALDASYAGFVARTFLARPWLSLDPVTDAPLDHNHRLVQTILEKEGLSKKSAESWVKLAETVAEPDELVQRLAASMEP